MSTSISQIQQYISNNQFDKALNICKLNIKDNPKNAVLTKLLAHIYGLKEAYMKAIEVLEGLINEFPNDFDLNNNLGFYYFKIEEFEKASFFLNKAKDINPSIAAPYQNLGEIFMSLRQFNLAENELDLCLEINAKNHSHYFIYMPTLLLRIQVYIAKKDKEGATNFILKYLLMSFHSELFLQLVQINKNAVTESLLAFCTNLLNKNTFQSSMEKFQHLVPLCFALAYYFEKKDQNKSENYFVQANLEIFSIQRLRLIDIQNQQKKIMNMFEKIKSLEVNDRTCGINNYFIVGMPRSGTTLLESIITANDEVFAGGELNAMSLLTKINILSKDQPTLSELEIVGREYLRITNFLKQEYQSLVDKMPMNFSYLGFIHKCLPAAKTILIIRNPWDIAISLFKQRYITNIAYSSSFFNIGVQIANFEAMLIYWQKSIINQKNIIILRYEDLVAELASQQSKIYDYLGIKQSYDPKIREKFFAKTASMTQVQSNIHQTSIKKSDFTNKFNEYFDAYSSQKEYWIRNDIKFEDSLLNIYKN